MIIEINLSQTPVLHKCFIETFRLHFKALVQFNLLVLKFWHMNIRKKTKKVISIKHFLKNI